MIARECVKANIDIIGLAETRSICENMKVGGFKLMGKGVIQEKD